MGDVNISCHLKDVGLFHKSSFNFVIQSELNKACAAIDPVFTDKEEVKISVSEAVMKQMQYPMDLRQTRRTVYPSEARLRLSTYYAQLHLELHFENPLNMLERCCTRIFYVPVMVKSNLCFLNGMSDQQLIKMKEDINDPGGYFIIKGKERLFKHFVVPRRNYPFAVVNNKYISYRDKYSKFGVFIRSVKDETLLSNVSLHFLTNGTYEVRLYHNSASYHIPLMLLFKALLDKNDLSICNDVTKFSTKFPLLQLKNMIRALHTAGVSSHIDAKKYLGKLFHGVTNLPMTSSFDEVAEDLLKKSLLVHLEDFEDKFNFLCFSLCKLYSVVQGNVRPDDLDNPGNHEILSSGQIYIVALKLGVMSYLKSVKNTVNKSIKRGTFNFERSTLEKCCNRAVSFSAQIASVIATGNLPGKRMHGFPSDTGYTVSLKRTNVFEVTAQFTALCKFSMEHYSKNMRNFYPEAWGFLCPTQTPEGERCGLTNHLASQCKIVKLNENKIVKKNLYKLGVLPCDDPLVYFCHQKYFVFVDGCICGFINSSLADKFIHSLKKMRSSNEVPYHAELVLITQDQHLFPGIFLLSMPCRLVRKVLHNSKEEFIGCFEQALSKEVISIETTNASSKSSYCEINTTQFLSFSAAMIPFLENNQAVRNIFSSVKCKQALSFPFMNHSGRSDTKFMQLMYGQTPLVSCKLYNEAGFQDYPHGINIVIAVLSYSGFDMEDAIVLSRSSVERGLFENVVFKTTFYDFEDLAQELECKQSDMEFKRNEDDPGISHFLDEGGLPYVGCQIRHNNPILSVYCKINKRWLIKRYLERSDVYIHTVKMTGDSVSTLNSPKNNKKIAITLSKRKIPEVGDKFSNRHGGKGICSVLMNSEDLPFTADGTVPDILFNPNGLPSRMSVGMLLEILAAKLAAIQGHKITVEPFTYKTVYKTIGEGLMDVGYDYYGKEKFYSGTSGEELEADVYCGCIYYQRFHHFTEEKYQVQSVGPVDERTYQPINPGRSGAVRFGEMERDAILSHGAAELTLDRLLLSSDKCFAFLCTGCHMLLYPSLQNPIPEERCLDLKEIRLCRVCATESSFKVQIPYVLIYLIVELAVIGIKVKISDK